MLTSPELDIQLHDEINPICQNLVHLKKVVAFDALASTNSYAHVLEKSGHESGTIVIAKNQTHGRGRASRSWFMQEGDIALTILLRKQHFPSDLGLLPLMPAVAVVQTLQTLGVGALLKWPNDIVIKDALGLKLSYFFDFRKLGGILVENICDKEEVVSSLIGIGINVVPNLALKEKVPHAHSVQELIPELCRKMVVSKLLQTFDKLLCQRAEPTFAKKLFASYETHCATLGHEVSFEHAGILCRARATGLGPNGSLVVNDGSTEHRIYAGDVHFAATTKNDK